MTVSPTASLVRLGITLPSPATPLAAYVPVRVSPDTAWVSGQGPTRDGISLYTGRLGADLTISQGADAARLAAINVLAALAGALGSLERVREFQRVAVMVASTPEFTDHPAVANGASDLFIEVFGEAGRHARVAFGVAALPAGWAVEVEAQVALAP